MWIKQCPWCPLTKQVVGVVDWKKEKCPSQWNIKNGWSIIKNWLNDLTIESISMIYGRKKQKYNLAFLPMTICNNFLLIEEALTIVNFLLAGSKYLRSLIIKPKDLPVKQHQRKSINFGHKACSLLGDSRDLHKKIFWI